MKDTNFINTNFEVLSDQDLAMVNGGENQLAKGIGFVAGAAFRIFTEMV